MADIKQPLGPPPGLTVPPKPKLPISQLESLKFKANQIIESIMALQWTIEAGGHPGMMPAWPDILSKYNVLLSQTHNFSTALLQPFPTSTAVNEEGASSKPGAPNYNTYERIALHPNMGMTDMQLDGEVVPLLRNQQTTDVLRMENDTVRRLAEHMNTRGSLGVLGISLPPAPLGGFGAPKKPEYEDVLRECAEIRDAHDRRVERAVRAVDMLKEKFEWKQRLQVTEVEPEELDWDPRFGPFGRQDVEGMGTDGQADVGMESVSSGESDGDGNSDEDDEYNVEGALFNPDVTSPLDAT